jgi:sulfatase maturation enzyme AslB (radical SAM superfamily)
MAIMGATLNAKANPSTAAVPSASVISPETVLQVARELAARPFLPSAELGRKLELTREELKAIYAAIQKSAEAQAILGASPFYYLTKVLERLSSKDARRVTQIIKGESPQPPFETLELFISADCNVNCSFCYRRDRDYGDQRILGTQEFLDIINEFVDVGGKNMDVSGGLEPLLSPAINDVLKLGVDRGLRVTR